jgi:hypothetical protein
VNSPADLGDADYDHNSPRVGEDEYGSMFIMTRDGAAASYFKGEWQPGIIFEGRDLLQFARIDDPEEIRTFMVQADSALRTSLKPRNTW